MTLNTQKAVATSVIMYMYPVCINSETTAMAFSLSSTDVKLDGTHLKALCKDRFGNYHVSAIELDHYIVNIDGILAWQPIGDFGKSSRHIGLDGSVLKCQSQTWDGEWRDTWINIDEKISNYNGKLIYKFEHAIIKVDEGNKHEVMNYIDDIYKAHKTTVHAQAAEMKGGSTVITDNMKLQAHLFHSCSNNITKTCPCNTQIFPKL